MKKEELDSSKKGEVNKMRKNKRMAAEQSKVIKGKIILVIDEEPFILSKDEVEELVDLLVVTSQSRPLDE